MFAELDGLEGVRDDEEKKGTNDTLLAEAMIEFVKKFVVNDVRSANGHKLEREGKKMAGRMAVRMRGCGKENRSSRCMCTMR